MPESVPPQLFAILKNKDGSINKESAQKSVLALEEMFEASWEIYKSVCYQGRKSMEIEGGEFDCNFTRPIIEIFSNYSKEHQLKRKKTINHGLVNTLIHECKLIWSICKVFLMASTSGY